jgi:Txe/YoeB family toxin of toxin-antitoxin system
VNDWNLVYTRQAQKDAKRLAASGLRERAQKLLDLLAKDPFSKPPPFEKLVGDLAGAYSRRIAPCLIAQKIRAGFPGVGSLIAMVSKIPRG